MTPVSLVVIRSAVLKQASLPNYHITLVIISGKQGSELGGKGQSCYICDINLTISCVLFIIIYVVVDKLHCICTLKSLSSSVTFFSNIADRLPFLTLQDISGRTNIVSTRLGLHVLQSPPLWALQQCIFHPLTAYYPLYRKYGHKTTFILDFCSDFD